jgi:hypothetical protein
LALLPAQDPGGEIPRAVYLRDTKGCDVAAAPIVRTGDILFWTGFAAVLLAIGTTVAARVTRTT